MSLLSLSFLIFLSLCLLNTLISENKMQYILEITIKSKIFFLYTHIYILSLYNNVYISRKYNQNLLEKEICCWILQKCNILYLSHFISAKFPVMCFSTSFSFPWKAQFTRCTSQCLGYRGDGLQVPLKCQIL